ncbi:hypothetical protein [Aeromicrobium sp. CTD01-1L150]|uniref:hypothetical protein n=1 Tax=Aeromicrobium sp. CTD01-1L150 TaxID=3341830 RepID=UPI0035BF3D39
MRRADDRPRRLLTDWTTTAGLAGDGLLALVAGDEVTPEGIHLATLGYEVFVLGPHVEAAQDLARVHHVAVDVAAEALPQQWQSRFALAVTFDPALTPQLAGTLAVGGLLVAVGEAGADVDLSTLTEVLHEQGPDPDSPQAERFRLVAAHV